MTESGSGDYAHCVDNHLAMPGFICFNGVLFLSAVPHLPEDKVYHYEKIPPQPKSP